MAVAAVAGQADGDDADGDGGAAVDGADAAVFAEDIADAEDGGITITRLRVSRSASSGSGSQLRRSPAAGSGPRPQSASPLAQYLAWEAIRVEIERGNVPSRGNMLLLGSLSPPSGYAPGDPAAAAEAAASTGAATAAAASPATETAAPTAGSAETAVNAGQAASGAAAQPGLAQGWMAAARDSLARGSSRLMYGSAGDLPQVRVTLRWSSSDHTVKCNAVLCWGGHIRAAAAEQVLICLVASQSRWHPTRLA